MAKEVSLKQKKCVTIQQEDDIVEKLSNIALDFNHSSSNNDSDNK